MPTSGLIFESVQTSPSNIALIKYWGKKGFGYQLPENPSLSFTLTQSTSTAHLKLFDKREAPSFLEKTFPLQVIFEGQRQERLEQKIIHWLKKTFFLKTGKTAEHFYWEWHTSNTFPMGTGIASSASSFAAMAHCLTQAYKFFQETSPYSISSLARLGSGSAARSVNNGWAHWGFDSEEEASFFTPSHSYFTELCDAIILADTSEKKISSSQGHELMANHDYKTIRHERSLRHFHQCLEILTTDYSDDENNTILHKNAHTLFEIAQKEALELHALMMTAASPYFLIRPTTLEILEKILLFKEEVNFPVGFTLDAGPNVHLLFFKENKEEVTNFLQTSLASHHEILHDSCSI